MRGHGGHPDQRERRAIMTAAMMYDAVTGTAKPSIHTAIAAYTTVRNTLPPASVTMMPEIFSPRPGGGSRRRR